MGRVFSMVVVSMLPHVEFGSDDHWEDAPHFTFICSNIDQCGISQTEPSVKTRSAVWNGFEALKSKESMDGQKWAGGPEIRVLMKVQWG